MKWLSRFAIIAALMLPLPSYASQGSGCLPTSGTVSGLTLVQDINAANAAFISMNSGATAPVTDCSNASMLGQLWLDTSSNTVKVYDGASWLALGKVDASSHVWTPRIGGGTSSLTAGTTTDLGSVASGYVTINGGGSITGFGTSAEVGTIKLLKFAGTPTLAYSSNLILPTASNISVVVGDQAAAVYLGGGIWSVWAYTRADGTAVSTSSVFIGAVNFAAPITPTALGSNTNDWAPSGFSSSNVVRVSASSAINLTGLAAGTSGRVIQLYNVGAFNITLPNESSSSSAANRFAAGYDVILKPSYGVYLLYDGTASRWRVIGGSGDVQGPASSTTLNLPSYNDATGKNLRDSGVAYNDVRRLLSTITASGNPTEIGDSTVFTTWGSVYDEFEVVAENVVFNTNAVTCELNVYSGGAYQTSGYQNAFWYTSNANNNASNNLTTGIACSAASSTSNTIPFSGTFRVMTPTGVSFPKNWHGHFVTPLSASSVYAGVTGGFWGSNNAVTGVRIRASGGASTILSGKLKIYGIR